jgi:hypothetical protein
MVGADVFARAPLNIPLREQNLSLRKEYPSAITGLGHIREVAREKLEALLGTVDEALLDQILPPREETQPG